VLQDNYTSRVIGDFTLEERIGRGGMAAVYQAYQRSTQRQVAIKVISLDPLLDTGDLDEFQQRFAQEAAVIASLEHLHILPIYAYGVIPNDIAYFAMRLLQGGTLEARLRGGTLPVPVATLILLQIADGLQYAHSKGVIHRDLKPSNILFDNANNAYLTDFGLAKLTQSSLNLTIAGALMGTPAYIAPEQLYDTEVDHRADIYSLGVLSYHMLAGKPPFEVGEGGIMSLLKKHAEEMPPSLRAFNPDVPRQLEDVIFQALQKDPRRRFSNVNEMALALENTVKGRTTTGSYPVVKPPLRLRRRVRLRPQRRWMLALAALAALAVVALAALALRPPVLSAPLILPGASGTVDSIEVTDDDLRLAQARLGSSGFVGFIACNLSTELNATRARLMNDRMTGYHLAFRIYDSNSDRSVQPALIQQALDEGAKVIILCPFSAAMVADSLIMLQERGIPHVLVSALDSTYGGVLINWDNPAIGRAAGTFAGELIQDEMGGEANVLILDFPALPGIVERANAMQAALLETAPDADIVARVSGESVREVAYQVVRELINEGVGFDVILSINDAGALGAINAMEQAGFEPESVAVIGVNGEALAVEYIQQGHFMRATVPQDIETNVEGSLRATIKLLAGGSVPETILIPPNEIITRETLPDVRR